MAHPNEDLLRKGYAAFAAQDIPGLLSIWHPDITWTEGNHNALTGTQKGSDEVLALLGKVSALTDGTFALDIERVIADDSGAVVICNATAVRDGRSYAYRAAHVYRIENGKATSFEEFGDDGRATDAIFA